jgi:acyl carrier protein
MTNAMTRKEAQAAVVGILDSIAPEVDWQRFSTDVSIRDEVDLDSMDFLNFVIALHDDCGVEVPETDYAKLQTLDAIVDYLLAGDCAAR